MNNPLSKHSAITHLVWRRSNYPYKISSPDQLAFDDLNQDKPPRRIKWIHGHDRKVQNTGHSCDAGLPSIDGKETQYIDLVSDHLPQAMLVYKMITLPKLQELLSGVPEASKDDLDAILDKLWKVMFRFVMTVTYFYPDEKEIFEKEKELIIEALVGLVPARTRMGLLQLELNIQNCLELPLEGIYLRNADHPISPPCVGVPVFFRKASVQDNDENNSPILHSRTGVRIFFREAPVQDNETNDEQDNDDEDDGFDSPQVDSCLMA